MKVLWLADGGCHTGFGRVTHSIGERLIERGHDVHVLAVNYRGDYYPTTLKLYRPDLYLGVDTYGASRILEMLGKIMPDVVVILNDPQVVLQLLFENQYDSERVLLQMRPIIAYLPCDGINLPPMWTNLLPKVTNVVAMSKWGQDQYEGSKLVYHGVDTDQFWPVSEKPITTSGGEVLRSKRECKKAFGFDPDGFLILRIDKNSGRKDFAATWKALVPILRAHKDVQVHFHCAASQLAHGINMKVLMSRYPDINPERIFFPDLHNSWVGWPQEDLNALYNAADLFVSTSRGEGFGLTLAEAAACGVPVVAQNVSAIPEVVGGGARLIDPDRLLTVPSGEDVWLSNIDAFTDAIEELYNSAGARRDLGAAGREHVLKSFSWDVAADKFDYYIRALAGEGNAVLDNERAAAVGS